MWNLPNLLTMSRLVLAVIYFWLLTMATTSAHDAAVAVFIVAGVTDIMDGWLARRWNVATAFGRMADPLIDKILIIGGFFYFSEGNSAGIVQFWMVLLVLGRELVVTSMRFIAESKGNKFAATIFGKTKMFIQFVTLVYLPIYLGHFRGNWLGQGVAVGLTWTMVVATFLSAVPYLIRARVLMRGTTPNA